MFITNDKVFIFFRNKFIADASYAFIWHTKELFQCFRMVLWHFRLVLGIVYNIVSLELNLHVPVYIPKHIPKQSSNVKLVMLILAVTFNVCNILPVHVYCEHIFLINPLQTFNTFTLCKHGYFRLNVLSLIRNEDSFSGTPLHARNVPAQEGRDSVYAISSKVGLETRYW